MGMTLNQLSDLLRHMDAPNTILQLSMRLKKPGRSSNKLITYLTNLTEELRAFINLCKSNIKETERITNN